MVLPSAETSKERPPPPTVVKSTFPLSSFCARCRELQLLVLIEDICKRKQTPYGKTAIIWQKKDQQ